MSEVYTEDYYMRGPDTGLSNYRDYQWMPDLTLPMADQARWLLGIRSSDVLYDFGAAKGFFVKALRQRGVQAYGYDVSSYAIANCDPAVKEYVSNTLELPEKGWDIIWSKDVFEHLPVGELKVLVPALLKATRRLHFIVVPLAVEVGGAYGCPVDELDSTHVIRWDLPEWLSFLQGFSHLGFLSEAKNSRRSRAINAESPPLAVIGSKSLSRSLGRVMLRRRKSTILPNWIYTVRG
jgi:SAM-dependent methyltransferase